VTCASVTARELTRGAQQLSFRHRYLNHELAFTLTQADERGDLWSMVATGRIGEPALLQLSLNERDGVLHTEWRIADATKSETFERSIGADVRLGDFRVSGFDRFELALLSSLSFFDELTDFHRNLYRQTATPMTMRTRAEVLDLFSGFDLIEPGVVLGELWRPDAPIEVQDAERFPLWAGIGRKP